MRRFLFLFLVFLFCGIIFPADSNKDNQSPVYYSVLEGNGELVIDKDASTDMYEVYFHVPISIREQVPLLIRVESPQMIDCRFLHLNPPNILGIARMRGGVQAPLKWKAWVLVKNSDYGDLPAFVPFPDKEELPEEVKKWLIPTDIAQISDPFVKGIATSLREDSADVMELSDKVALRCQRIRGELPHLPYAFDAHYALRWGSSCTGRAHAGAALFRANGIPSRSIHIITYYDNYVQRLDMHWVIDYYVPNYGWLYLETSRGINPFPSDGGVIMFASNPEDEFCLFTPGALDVHWHSSDPVLGMYNPDWNRSHFASFVCPAEEPAEQEGQLLHLANEVFRYYTQYWGLPFGDAREAAVRHAYFNQEEAVSRILEGDMDGFTQHMRQALKAYEWVKPAPVETIFFDDFENGVNGWTHHGILDQWQWGVPGAGPANTHSGKHCWGTNLDGAYENNADCRLLSPPIDLTGQTCAYLSCWIWNRVLDDLDEIYDPLSMVITTDGVEFIPLCNNMGGGNDDPEVPDVPGWSRVVLDLTRYIGQTVRIGFRFRSTSGVIHLPGAYIDDFHVYGRRAEPLQDGIQLKVSAARKIVNAWLVSKAYVGVTIELADPAKVSRLVVYRKTTLSSYDELGEIPLSEVQDGSYKLNDMSSDLEYTYTYVVAALDADDRIIEIANSAEI